MNDYKKLIAAAFDVRERAYAPYSGITVGAALLTTDGKIFSGCNVENASFSPTLCAERNAISTAISSGYRDFAALAVVGGAYERKAGDVELFYPCGVCRQWLAEFCPADFIVIVARSVDDYQQTTLAELLPHSFSANDIR